MEPKFIIADVFGFEKYTGNQLAVFYNCGSLSSAEMQKMAREINFSETTFITSGEKVLNGYDVRIFTPEEEIPFAGHPTLGTAYVIKKLFEQEDCRQVILNVKVGQIPVDIDGNELWMKQIAPSFGAVHDIKTMASVLNLCVDDIDERFPAQEVSTGLPFTIVPLKSMAALKRAKIGEEYWKFVETAEAKGILVFAPEGYTAEQKLSVRVFVNYFGIPEDPATGSGNGCLGGYLVKNKYFGAEHINIKTGQGYEINRPSELYIKARQENGSIDIRVGGKVFTVAEGDWR
ncbi:MAG TPA: PhzF family phenazine biosynthesis protein [Ignavibacteriales bacterium]|nr:PhzF family phenazine biosynthesis protein [Ignavibacteriales bacterium]